MKAIKITLLDIIFCTDILFVPSKITLKLYTPGRCSPGTIDIMLATIQLSRYNHPLNNVMRVDELTTEFMGLLKKSIRKGG